MLCTQRVVIFIGSKYDANVIDVIGVCSSLAFTDLFFLMPVITAVCRTSGKTFSISEAEQTYCLERKLPLPQQHPFERMKHIANWRNRFHLYNTTCAASQKSILSCFPPEKGLVIYDSEVWNGDSWDATSFGQDYDPSRPFFEQFGELMKRTPLPNLNVSGVENSDYVNGAISVKNCYLTFSCFDCQDCLFCWVIGKSRNLIDCIHTYFSELCYSCMHVENCYNCRFVESSNHCSDSSFLLNCQACKHCFGCVNLNNKEYCWYNEQLTKEEYEKRLADLDLGTLPALAAARSQFQQFCNQFPIKYYAGKSIENSSGNHINNLKDSHNDYYCSNDVDVEHSLILLNSKDCFGMISAKDGELSYNCHSGIHYNCQYCSESGLVRNRNVMWSLYTNNSTYCFGCISIKNKQYCILNKQYSAEEYFKLRDQIQQSMVANNEHEDFFPRHLSPFYYNESDALTYFPISQEQAEKEGFHWGNHTVESYVSDYTIPEHIKDVHDDILQAVLLCQKSGKKYRITKQELEYYRTQQLPIPRISPLERIGFLASRLFIMEELHLAQCHQCQKQIETVYDTSKRTVLCEECYVQAVY